MSVVRGNVKVMKGNKMILIEDVVWSDDSMFDGDVYLTEKESD